MPDPRHLTPEQIQNRLERYYTDEPLASIARDHGVGETAIIRTAERYAPWAIGMRNRGADAARRCREWNPDAR